MARQELVADLLKTVSDTNGFGTFDPLGATVQYAVGQELIVTYGPDWVLSGAGETYLAAYQEKKAAQRKKASAASRARSAALSSCGLKRTRYGWE